MVYHAGDMLLDPVGELLRSTVNDVLICRDLRSPVGRCYLLLLVKDRLTVRQLLAVFQASDRVSLPETEPYLLRFTENEQMGFVFPHREGRRLSTFASSQGITPFLRESICIHLVMECLSCPLPYPLLYLLLTQDGVHLSRDNTVYLLPALDLKELDPKKGESACASACAWLLLELLEGGGRRPLKSYLLIRKKISKHAYGGFPELYHDIKLTAIPETKTGLRTRLKGFWRRNRDRLFHIFLVLCVALTVVAALCLISQLIFGDIPFLRLFERAFEVIGTERLT